LKITVHKSHESLAAKKRKNAAHGASPVGEVEKTNPVGREIGFSKHDQRGKNQSYTNSSTREANDFSDSNRPRRASLWKTGPQMSICAVIALRYNI
jgi:hypothetical protein